MPEQPTTIEKYQIENCQIQEIVIPKSVTIIKENAFQDYKNLEKIVLVEGSALT